MIVNLQRKVKIRGSDFMPFLLAVRSAVEEIAEGHISVAFVSDTRMKELNRFFRDNDSTTDVLSFPHRPDEFETEDSKQLMISDTLESDAGAHIFLGDIVISVEQAARQAEQNKLSLNREIKQLILHGALHLCGYDHETDHGEMDAREIELRNRLDIN